MMKQKRLYPQPIPSMKQKSPNSLNPSARREMNSKNLMRSMETSSNVPKKSIMLMEWMNNDIPICGYNYFIPFIHY